MVVGGAAWRRVRRALLLLSVDSLWMTIFCGSYLFRVSINCLSKQIGKEMNILPRRWIIENVCMTLYACGAFTPTTAHVATKITDVHVHLVTPDGEAWVLSKRYFTILSKLDSPFCTYTRAFWEQIWIFLWKTWVTAAANIMRTMTFLFGHPVCCVCGDFQLRLLGSEDRTIWG